MPLPDTLTENICPSFRVAMCSPGGSLHLLLIATFTSLITTYSADILSAILAAILASGAYSLAVWATTRRFHWQFMQELLSGDLEIRPGRSVWVGCIGGKVVGSVAIEADNRTHSPSPRVCWFCSFYVNVSWRRLGVGQLLAQTALRHARNSGYIDVYLDTFHTRRDAPNLVQILPSTTSLLCLHERIKNSSWTTP
uniref:N-acetyltransferase domain-containing protein n=1 Tax=Callorhinchus milii TaxID=7868 RepID=A0A4W3I5F0_CALMI